MDPNPVLDRRACGSLLFCGSPASTAVIRRPGGAAEAASPRAERRGRGSKTHCVQALVPEARPKIMPIDLAPVPAVSLATSPPPPPITLPVPTHGRAVPTGLRNMIQPVTPFQIPLLILQAHFSQEHNSPGPSMAAD